MAIGRTSKRIFNGRIKWTGNLTSSITSSINAKSGFRSNVLLKASRGENLALSSHGSKEQSRQRD